MTATWEPTAAGFKLNLTPGLQLNAHVGLGVLASQTYTVAPEHQNATSYDAPFARIVEGQLELSVDDSRVPSRSFSAPACLASFRGGPSPGEEGVGAVPRRTPVACDGPA